MAPTSLPITVTGLRKVYGSFVALDDVSLDIRAGEFLTLLGPSGSGKTTLLMSLAGFIEPDAGAMTLDGRDFTRLPPNRRGFGIVFQNYALFPHMSVAANVAYPLRVRAVPRAEARQRVAEALARVKLEGFGDRAIGALSGGQRQRVALARAIVYEPAVMLMDEPLSALDKNLREQMQFEIRKLHDDLGITTIYVTHDQREALTMSDRIAIMDGGRIRQIGTPLDIYNRPCSRFVAQFMGEANLLPAQGLGGPGADTFASAGERLVMIRAEHLDFGPAEPGSDRVEVVGRLAARAFRGENWLLEIETSEGCRIRLSIPAAQGARCADLAPDTEIRTSAAVRHVHLFDAEPRP